MRSSFRAISLVIGFSLLGISALLVFQKISRQPHYGGGFRRILRNEIFSYHQVLDLGYNSYYIAGTAPEQIFLANYTVPSHILSVSTRLQDTSALILQFPATKQFVESALQISIQLPKVFAIESITPALMEGLFPDGVMKDGHLPKSRIFGIPTMLSSNSIVAKEYNQLSQETVLSKISKIPGESLNNPEVLNKQIDGLFCVDGFLLSDPSSGRLIYVYYYRNEFICMDTSLNISYRAHTIDTVTRAHLKVSTIVSEKQRTLSAPPVFVNKRGSILDGKIFIHSVLKADNEDIEQFEKSFVIDVYSGESGRYSFSFYLPRFSDRNLNSFVVMQDRIVTIQDRYLISYLIEWNSD